MKRIWTLIFLLASSGCISGVRKDDRRSQDAQGVAPAGDEGPAQGGEEGDGTAGSRTLRLKNGDLLSQSLFRTLGRGKSLQAEGGQDLFATFGKNFGGTKDLRLGEIHADSPSVGYVLALGIVADNAAKVCAVQTAAKDPEAEQCKCGSRDDALAMMQRAMPFADFTDPAKAALVDEFAAACEKDPAAAIFSLISSLSFAVKI